MKIVRDCLQPKAVLHTVTPSLSVREAAQMLVKHAIGAAPVIEGGRLVGVLSERDLIVHVLGPGLDPQTTPVSAVMSHSLLVATPDTPVNEALEKMHAAHVRHLLVVDGPSLVGFISLRDLLLVDHTERSEHIDLLEHYMFTIPPGYPNT